MDIHHPQVGKEIKSTGKLEEATEAMLRSAISDFKNEFAQGISKE
jgi:hypothetical protein